MFPFPIFAETMLEEAISLGFINEGDLQNEGKENEENSFEE